MGFDPFKLESGLLDNADVTFTDAEFTNRLDSFDPTKLELHLTTLVEGDDGGEQVLFFGCGDGWEATDKGQSAVREDGKERSFHVNTKVGELFKSIISLMDDDKALDKELRGRLKDYPNGPREAGFWKGLKFHLEREDRKGGGEVGDYQVLVATAFNGVKGGAKAGPAKGAAKKAAAPKAAPKAEGGVTDAIRAALDEIADASADHDSFMEAALAQVPEASTDDAVKAAIMDDGEGSIWQDAVARYEASQAEG
jgi:hypothetical protein